MADKNAPSSRAAHRTQSLIPPSSEQYTAVLRENIANDHKEACCTTRHTVSSSNCSLYFELPHRRHSWTTSCLTDNNSINLRLLSAALIRFPDLRHTVCLGLWIAGRWHLAPPMSECQREERS